MAWPFPRPSWNVELLLGVEQKCDFPSGVRGQSASQAWASILDGEPKQARGEGLAKLRGLASPLHLIALCFHSLWGGGVLMPGIPHLEDRDVKTKVLLCGAAVLVTLDAANSVTGLTP